MSLCVSGVTFDGPFSSTNDLGDQSGVYLIVCQLDGKYHPIDCGESATVRRRIASHDRRDCWQANAFGQLAFAVHYTPGMQKAERREIESMLRNHYAFPCGDR